MYDDITIEEMINILKCTHKGPCINPGLVGGWINMKCTHKWKLTGVDKIR